LCRGADPILSEKTLEVSESYRAAYVLHSPVRGSELHRLQRLYYRQLCHDFAIARRNRAEGSSRQVGAQGEAQALEVSEQLRGPDNRNNPGAFAVGCRHNVSREPSIPARLRDSRTVAPIG
jgi:hypothetical protein